MSSGHSSISTFLIRWIATSIAVSFAIAIIPGVSFAEGSSDLMVNILVLSLFLALINISIQPILQALGLPLSVLTFGIFALVINTAMLYLAGWCAATLFGVDFIISNFSSAFIASIVISIATWLISELLD